MTDVEATYEDFIASRRSGRRNAIHEIPAVAGVQGPAGGQEPAELSEGLPQLSANQPGDEGEDAEKSQDSAAKGKEAQADGT